MNKKFVFVILHYETYLDTIECVESILGNVEYDNYEIVIVDNCSKNNSGVNIQEKYKEEKKVHVMLLNENFGFANGNNKGCEYAKKFNPDFLCVINNDTEIRQKEFLDKIIDRYQQEVFHILGPDIVSIVDKGHQNPYDSKFNSLEDVVRYEKKVRIDSKLIYLRTGLLGQFFRFLKYKIFRRKRIIADENINNKDWKKELHNTCLHGSALVFSKDYIEKYENVFYNKTFMYGEEDILHYIATRDKLKTVYYPTVQIFHKEDSATDAILGKGLKKLKFIYKHNLDSLKELKTLMKNDLKLSNYKI